MIADNFPPPIQNRLWCDSTRVFPSLREYPNKMVFVFFITPVDLIGYHSSSSPCSLNRSRVSSRVRLARKGYRWSGKKTPLRMNDAANSVPFHPFLEESQNSINLSINYRLSNVSRSHQAPPKWETIFTKVPNDSLKNVEKVFRLPLTSRCLVPPKPDRQGHCLPLPVPTKGRAGRKRHN